MCLALPGRIEARMDGPNGLPFARVRFGAITQDVCLSFVPDAAVGDYVIVHVGFAIQRLDTVEAERTLALAAAPATKSPSEDANSRATGGAKPEGAS
ncbi:MAG: HypC/HybG/HupF family hydrogenase formation chaperone [Sandaracinaceae bacterium]|nr:HypC/HybG/HupF family hydrogenase formation chaperone [Sandaracinaceae bacterium]